MAENSSTAQPIQAMPVDEALAHADEWIKGVTVYPGLQGWRVACATLATEVRRLRGEVRVLRGSHGWLSREKERLESAIKRTLDENGHLADGDDCTLIHLARAMPTPNGGGSAMNEGQQQ